MSLMEKVAVPEGRAGNWRIERFSVTEESSRFDALRSAIRGSGRYTPAGDYTRLLRGSCVVMSDTPDEMRDHYEPVRRARASVLINGLGLGMVLKAILAKPEVTDVTVVEKSPDVISLVSPVYTDARLEIVCSDAFDYQPPKGKRYSVVWHDIWDNICADNLEEMKRLHRKYGHRADWQGSWARYQCERYAGRR